MRRLSLDSPGDHSYITDWSVIKFGSNHAVHFSARPCSFLRRLGDGFVPRGLFASARASRAGACCQSGDGGCTGGVDRGGLRGRTARPGRVAAGLSGGGQAHPAPGRCRPACERRPGPGHTGPTGLPALSRVKKLPRKVRTPQSKAVGNSHPEQSASKCNRE